ncbi:hypothetical protein NSP_5500 [Nodularia spumigena CCY9414]|nr:hypothetical protein NSP_5500 [Nodularia spumigena CCY9414]
MGGSAILIAGARCKMSVKLRVIKNRVYTDELQYIRGK